MAQTLKLLFCKKIEEKMLGRTTIILVMLLNAGIFSQAFESKWGLGGGVTYPRFFSVTGTGISGNENYGAYFSIEKYFNEQVSLRGLFNFTHMESNYYLVPGSPIQIQTVNQFALNADVLYKFLPCRLVSPYVLFGLGITNFTNDHSFNPELDDTFFGYQFNLGAGIEWGFSEDLALKTEAVYRTASNNKLDGNYSLNENSKGLFGGNGDTYATFDVGLIWYFNKGNISNICEKCPEGVREVLVRDTVYVERIKEIQKTIVDTVYVEKPTLFGVNFNFDKYVLSPESYPILDHDLRILKTYPDINIILSGFTDNFGGDQYNDKLSENRVNAVYNFLVSSGINSNRINKKWYGESDPVRSNDSAIDRAFNRRVEIKVLGK